jgi:Tol biopolymer transport system component
MRGGPSGTWRRFVIFALVILLAAAAFWAASRMTYRRVRSRPARDPRSSTFDLSALRPSFAFGGGIVFQSDLDGDNDIYLLTGTGLRRLTDDPASDEFPKWSPDGRSISFSSNRTGRYQIHVMAVDGSGVRQVTRSEADAIEQAWFPDGRRLAFTEERRRGLGRSFVLREIGLEGGEARALLPGFDGSSALPEFSPAAPLLAFTGKRLRGWDVYAADRTSGAVRPLTEGGRACRPHFSPDGAKIAFTSSEADGKGDIWIMNPDGSGRERLTDLPETYDYFASWSPDGRSIVFSTSADHYPTQGVWSLSVVRVATRRVVPLFRSGSRDVFPDWR